MVQRLLLLTLLLGGCSAPTPTEEGREPGPSERLVLTGGTLIDGTGKDPVENATLVIAENRIEAVLTEADPSQFGPDTRIISVQGKYLVPGYIDAHVHLLGWALPMYLPHGITSVTDLGNWTPWILALKSAVEDDLISGPRIFAAGGQIDSPPGSFQHSVNVTSEDEARQVVREHARRGADFIKAYTMIRPSFLRVIIEEANELGLPVRGHITVSAREAAEFGIRTLEHMSGVAIATIDEPEILEEVEEGRKEPAWVMESVPELAARMNPDKFDDLIELLVRRKTAITPTLVSWWTGVHSFREKYSQEDVRVLDDPRLFFIPEMSRRTVLGRYERTRLSRGQPRFERGYSNTQRFIKAFLDAGGLVLAGSDSTMGSVHGLDLHREMELLVEAGLSPLQALQAATRNPAQAIGKEAELGTLEPGKLADVLVLSSNPLEDIRNTRSVETVLKAGQIQEIEYDPGFQDLIPRPMTSEYLRYFQSEDQP